MTHPTKHVKFKIPKQLFTTLNLTIETTPEAYKVLMKDERK